MTDISINSSSIEKESKYSPRNDNSYAALKREYDKFKKDVEKSDFANSPTALERELALITKLKKAAYAQGFDSEVKKLTAREQKIYTIISNKIVSDGTMPYYKPISFQGNTKASKNDFSEENFMDFVEQNFENPSSIKDDISIMQDSGINKNETLRLLNLLKVKNPETGTFCVSDDSVKNIIQLKKLLTVTRIAERTEFANPLNHLNEVNFNDGRNTFVFQNGGLAYSTPLEGERDISSRKEEYENAISEKEDKLLYSLVEHYKQKDGSIDNKALRTFISLRRCGITYDNLLPMIDYCIGKDGEIDKEKLSVIADLKKAGVLSSDVMLIADSAYNDYNGTYDSVYLDSAKKLTASVVKSVDVLRLLIGTKGNEDAGNFVQRYAALLDVDSVMELENVVRNEDGTMNSNAIDIVDSVFYNPVMQDENGEIEFAEFLSTAESLVDKVKQLSNPQEGISESATEAVFQLCQKSMKIEDITGVLEHCCDEDGYINDILAKIAYQMSWNDEKPDMIIEMLDSCKDGNKVNSERAQDVINLY